MNALRTSFQEARLAEAGEALERAGSALRSGTLRSGTGAEYAAADLRDALRALDEIAGATPREAVLDLHLLPLLHQEVTPAG